MLEGRYRRPVVGFIVTKLSASIGKLIFLRGSFGTRAVDRREDGDFRVVVGGSVP